MFSKKHMLLSLFLLWVVWPRRPSRVVSCVMMWQVVWWCTRFFY